MKIFRSVAAAIGIFALAALTSFLQPAAAQQAGDIYCSQTVKYDASSNGATRIFTANAASPRQMLICSYIINVGATATNVGLSYGTGTNCGTGTTALTPTWVLPIAGQVADDAGVWHGLTVPAGNDLCVVTSAGNPVQAIVHYTYQ